MLMFLILLQAATAPQAPSTPLPPVCPQLAERIPSKPPTATRTSWRFDTRGGIKGLFSGGITTAFGTTPVNQNDPKQWQRSEAMCFATPKGGECKLEGLVKFGLSSDGKEFGWQIEPGERFLFRVRGTVLECEDLPIVARGVGDV